MSDNSLPLTVIVDVWGQQNILDWYGRLKSDVFGVRHSPRNVPVLCHCWRVIGVCHAYRLRYTESSCRVACLHVSCLRHNAEGLSLSQLGRNRRGHLDCTTKMKQASVLLFTQLGTWSAFLRGAATFSNAFVNRPSVGLFHSSLVVGRHDDARDIATARSGSDTKLYFFDFLKQSESSKKDSKGDQEQMKQKEDPEFDDPAEKIFSFFFGQKEEEPMVCIVLLSFLRLTPCRSVLTKSTFSLLIFCEIGTETFRPRKIPRTISCCDGRVGRTGCWG